MIAVPTLEKNYEDNGELHLIIKNIHVSVANAIRRTILTDIPIVVIRTETSKINNCTVLANTSRFHNEIIKQRLSCVPIFTQDLENFPEKYRLIVNVQNESDNEMRWVTTDDFQLQDKENETILDKTETVKIFPHGEKGNRPIDFLRLRPSIGSTIPGEQIHLTAEFDVCTAKVNGMFNAVSKCAYFNVIDSETRENVWAIHLQRLKNQNKTEEEIKFEYKNFMNLDAYRCYKVNKQGEPNEFEFVIKTIGQYSNQQIVYKACDILVRKLLSFVSQVQSEVVPIHKSTESRDNGYTSVTISSIENSYDIILENEDYTLGLLLEYMLHLLFYNEETPLTFIGFKKYHPHDDYSVIRMAYNYGASAHLLTRQYLIEASAKLQKILETIRDKFKGGS